MNQIERSQRIAELEAEYQRLIHLRNETSAQMLNVDMALVALREEDEHEAAGRSEKSDPAQE